MDNSGYSPFQNPLDAESSQKKNLFSNRVNLSDNLSNGDGFYNLENLSGYLPERSSKLWNHINTRPYLSENYPSYAMKEAVEPMTFESYKEYVQKVVGEDDPERIDVASDIFSETEENVSILNKLQSLNFSSPASLEQSKAVSELNVSGYPELSQPEKAFEPENKFEYSEVKPEFESEYKRPNAVGADLNSVTTSDSVKQHQPLKPVTRAELVPQIKEVVRDNAIPLPSGLTTISDVPNPFGFNHSTNSDFNPQKSHYREAKFKGSELINYSQYIDYNPFSIFSVQSSGNNTAEVSEAELKRLRGVILANRYSEETLVRFFTEAICITNTCMMSQIIQFLIGLIRENHKVRPFVVRLMLCALSFHPEEFTGLFRVEYLNSLFTPTIDDSVGVHFLKLLLSYKSTFNSKTELSPAVPYSLDCDGKFLYTQHHPNISTGFSNTDVNQVVSHGNVNQVISHGDIEQSVSNGRVEMLYMLKILADRSRVSSVFELQNSMLREQLCMIWHDMPKTMPEVNLVVVLLHWVNSPEDLESKKYAFLLLQKIRDLRPFPGGQTLLLSQFFLFALRQGVRVNDHLEYLISLCSEHQAEGDSLSHVLYGIMEGFSEPDLFDLWCLICVIPWKVTSPKSAFSSLFITALNTILRVTALDKYEAGERRVRLDLLENCLRICLARCSCPVNALNSLLQTTLLLNSQTLADGGLNLVLSSVSRNGMILNSLAAFLWKCHFLWTRIKEGVSLEVLVVVTELYRIMARFTSVKPLDSALFDKFSAANNDEIYRFFSTHSAKGVWTKIAHFIPDINLVNYFTSQPGSHYQHNSNTVNPVDGVNPGVGVDTRPSRHYKLGELDNLVDTKSSRPYKPGELGKSDQQGGHSVVVVGLKNLGNSCYLNSLLQALYHTRLFVHNLAEYHRRGGGNRMVSSLVRLFGRMRAGERACVSPRGVFRLVSASLSGSQQDVTEAIRVISESIDGELELWRSVFAGLVVRRVRCLRCGFVSDNEETSFDLSLPLSGARSVQQMLDGFSEVETLSGVNKYLCLGCGRRVRAQVRSFVASPASHLIVILNRNEWAGNGSQKVLRRVRVDAELALAGFSYRLYGAVIHSGGSSHSGHYYFVGSDSELPGPWHRISDHSVRPCAEDEVDRISRDSSNNHGKVGVLSRDANKVCDSTEGGSEGLKRLYLVKPRGFCEGVSRAIRTVEEALRVFGPPIYVKHEIVHNEAVCNRLREKGVKFIEDLELVPEGSVVIFSAHGVPPAVREKAKERNLFQIDASCPLVNKVHVYVKNKAKEGYKIVLVGHKNHQEIIGTSGEAPEAVTVVESVADVEALCFPEGTKVFYTTQTTLSLDDCKEITEALVKKYPKIETIPSGSICYATTNRQTAIHKVTQLVDLVLIVGSKLSSNAKRLVEAALNRNVKSYLIFDANDVTEKLVGNAKNIALSSSASTPEDLTLAVLEKLKSPPFNFTPEEFDGAVERVPNWRLPR